MKYRRFKCANCGNVGLDRSPEQNKRFCSRACTDAWHNRNKYPTAQCKFNEGVICGKHNCKACGWNPKVAAKRMAVVL